MTLIILQNLDTLRTSAMLPECLQSSAWADGSWSSVRIWFDSWITKNSLHSYPSTYANNLDPEEIVDNLLQNNVNYWDDDNVCSTTYQST